MTKVDDQLEIKAYYAGHVLGAAMFQIRVGSQSIVYTGDYNMTPDRHLVNYPFIVSPSNLKLNLKHTYSLQVIFLSHCGG